MIGGIEAGGTKFICAVADQEYNIIDKVSIPTETPEITMPAVIDFFAEYQLTSLGVGSFGPIDVIRDSDTYGYITGTPKLAWRDFNFLAYLYDHLDIEKIGWDTDVNAAGLAEYYYGQGQHKNSLLYLTIGTGIGGGFINQGQVLQAAGHPEMGHIVIDQDADDNFAGLCPAHGNCLEGLAAGPTVAARLGQSSHEISPDHQVYNYLADYIGQGLRDFTVLLRPEVIVIGGGLMNVPGLMDKVRQAFDQLFNHYLPLPDLDDYIVSPGLGDQAGIIGAMILGQKALKK
ncbi:fructokinase [Aerococcus urinaehominis]|uniref:fructokinase n=1 Tax=Aerococcus urinaehominis TaxID=128944 RepID=A0A0X8FKM4_9LACT|nr:ROK family protein [Aerococcus urinaehominis]AMB99063.1 fructokinase [Aerococcus urinaehominis]SDM59570.1 fructokinase [Aerococcus urinaehominis]